jgi:hypothetical protein
MKNLYKSLTFLIIFILLHTLHNCQCNKDVDDDSPEFEVFAKVEKSDLTLHSKETVTTKINVTLTSKNDLAAQHGYQGTFSLSNNAKSLLSKQGDTSSIINVKQKLQEGENVFCYTPHNTGTHTLTISVIVDEYEHVKKEQIIYINVHPAEAETDGKTDTTEGKTEGDSDSSTTTEAETKEAARQAEEEKAKQAAETARQAETEAKTKQEAEAKRLAEKAKQETETKEAARKAEEEEKAKLAAKTARQAETEAKTKQEAEAKRLAEKAKQETETKEAARKAEEEEKAKLAAETARQAETEAKTKKKEKAKLEAEKKAKKAEAEEKAAEAKAKLEAQEAKRLAEKAKAVEKAVAKQAEADKATAVEKAVAEQAVVDKAAAEKATPEKVVAEQAVTEKVEAEKAATKKAAAEKQEEKDGFEHVTLKDTAIPKAPKEIDVKFEGKPYQIDEIKKCKDIFSKYSDQRIAPLVLETTLKQHLFKDNHQHIIYNMEPDLDGVLRFNFLFLVQKIREARKAGEEQIFIPIGLTNNETMRMIQGAGGHFTCIYLDFKNHIVEYYDSHSGIMGDIADTLMRLTQFEMDDNRLSVHGLIIALKNAFTNELAHKDWNKTSQQTDHYNCGRFMTHFIINRKGKTNLSEYEEKLADEIAEAGSYQAFFDKFNEGIVKGIDDSIPQEYKEEVDKELARLEELEELARLARLAKEAKEARSSWGLGLGLGLFFKH